MVVPRSQLHPARPARDPAVVPRPGRARPARTLWADRPAVDPPIPGHRRPGRPTAPRGGGRHPRVGAGPPVRGPATVDAVRPAVRPADQAPAGGRTHAAPRRGARIATEDAAPRGASGGAGGRTAGRPGGRPVDLVPRHRGRRRRAADRSVCHAGPRCPRRRRPPGGQHRPRARAPARRRLGDHRAGRSIVADVVRRPPNPSPGRRCGDRSGGCDAHRRYAGGRAGRGRLRPRAAAALDRDRSRAVVRAPAARHAVGRTHHDRAAAEQPVHGLGGRAHDVARGGSAAGRARAWRSSTGSSIPTIRTTTARRTAGWSGRTSPACSAHTNGTS